MIRRFLSSLRDYQEECITTSLEQFNLYGIKRQAVSLPVGAGKTVIILCYIEYKLYNYVFRSF